MAWPSGSPDSLKTKRKRELTKNLLDDDRLAEIIQSIQMPTPSTYDLDQLKRGHKYADDALRNQERKLSPIRAQALLVYRGACARLLDIEIEIEDLEDGEGLGDAREALNKLKVELASMIPTYEQAIQYHACLRIIASANEQELQDKSLELLRTIFFARYGDLFSEACRVVETTAKAKHVQGWQALSKQYWGEIQTRLAGERNSYMELLRTGRNFTKCPLHITLSDTCRVIGFNFKDMLAIIKSYATRNELRHSDLSFLIKSGKPMTLAKQLHDDFCDLPNIVPVTQVAELHLMQQLIQTIISLWFTKKGDEDKYERWQPTDRLEQLMDEYANKNIDDDIARWKAATAEVTETLKRRLQDEKGVKGLLLVESLDPKRVASARLEKETEGARKRGKQWEKLMSLMQNYSCKTMSDSDVADWGFPPIIGQNEIWDEPALVPSE